MQQEGAPRFAGTLLIAAYLLCSTLAQSSDKERIEPRRQKKKKRKKIETRHTLMTPMDKHSPADEILNWEGHSPSPSGLGQCCK